MLRSWTSTFRFDRTWIGMGSLVFLLHLAFALLRSARMALAVTDLGGSASCLPLFEICAAVPLSFVVIAGLNRLMHRVSLARAYQMAVAGFILFFGLFAFVAYPPLAQLKELDPAMLSGGESLWRQWMLLGSGGAFYAISELWRTVLLTVLFWSATNHLLSRESASKLYPRLVLAGSLGTMAAGPVASLTTAPWCQALLPLAGSRWELTLQALTLAIAAIGLLTMWIFPRLLGGLHDRRGGAATQPADDGAPQTGAAKALKGDPCRGSLKESFRVCISSMPLLWLAVSTLTDYVAYSLGEIVFLDLLKQWAPAPQDYYRMMGMLGTINGILTALGGAWLAPWVLRRLGWGAAACATPLAIGVLGAAFCSLVWFEPTLLGWGFSSGGLLTSAVMLGSCHYCLCRATKYTLFDPAKELAFIQMPSDLRMPGKMVVDGIVSRLGRGASSVLTLGLASLSGSLRATAGWGGLIASSIACVGVWAALSLSQLLGNASGRDPLAKR